jgi:hypothetical protein
VVWWLVKTDDRETGCKIVDWIPLAPDGVSEIDDFLFVSRQRLVRFEGATALFIKITVLRDVTPCVLVVRTELKMEIVSYSEPL